VVLSDQARHQQEAQMSLVLDNPIINNLFEEPSRWWDYSEGQPVLRKGRRPTAQA